MAKSSSKTLKIALAQLNPVVGDIVANADMLRAAHKAAATQGADMVLAGELFLSGYPPEDLVHKQSFLHQIRYMAEQLAAETKGKKPALVFGLPWLDDKSGALHNSVLVAENGQISVRHKVHLPNYSVFDEKRLFTSGALPEPVEICGVRFGLPICEDIWFDDIAAHLVEEGVEMLLSPNGSPFERDKHPRRLECATARCKQTNVPLIYVNQIGGQDELVFDGASFAMQGDANLCVQLPAWETALTITEWYKDKSHWYCQTQEKATLETGLAGIYQAMVLGLRDYVEKNRFPGVLLGLSGGIDSAICATIAVDALGADRVHCFMLPSRYTSDASLADAADCAARLGVRLDTIAISAPSDAVENALADLFADTAEDLTEENIQSRIRGTLLMAISNKFGHMLVTTGNKSEVSVGYATLYGDMNGGYNPIKDIYKTDIFALAYWRNENCPSGALGAAGDVIPVAIIEKPPSAELRDNQKDEDSLPPYDVLDDILIALVEEELSFKEIVARGHKEEIVKHIEHLLYISEYKRRQAAPGVKIGARNFGRDRRYPITNGFRDARFKG